MHGGAVEKGGLLLLQVHIVTDLQHQYKATLIRDTYGIEPADLRVAVGKSLHHLQVLGIGWIFMESQCLGKVLCHITAIKPGRPAPLGIHWCDSKLTRKDQHEKLQAARSVHSIIYLHTVMVIFSQ